MTLITRNLTADEVQQIEAWVNARIEEAIPVDIKELPIAEAEKLGAKMLFGEKYGDSVRVVSMGGTDVSLEFCGGCHVANTADLRSFSSRP